MSRTGTSEIVIQNEFPDDRFVSDEFILPSLQKIAAYQVSLPLWYNLISSEKRKLSTQKTKPISYFYDLMKMDFTNSENNYSVDSYYKKFDELVTISFSTRPKFVRLIVTECLREIHKNIYWWMHWLMNYFRETDYIQFNYFRMHDTDPNFCAWYPNGKIDYRRSAMNILSSPGLNARQRFSLMCKYCMEDEIKTFPLHLLDPEFIELINFDNDSLVYYWICYLKNTLHKIPKYHFNSIDVSMAVEILENNIYNRMYWTAFEYFWNRLGIEDQIIVTKWKFNSAYEDFESCGYGHSIHPTEFNLYNVPERLFSMLSWHQQRTFIYPKLDKTILIFLIRLDSPEITFWTWNHCKNLLTIEQFANMVDLILRWSVEFENAMKLFMHLWKQVPAHFRTYALEMKENEMIGYFSNKKSFSPSSIKFLCEFLSLKSCDFRKNLILENAVHICTFIKDPHCITELINSCLPNQIHQMEFKKLVRDSNPFKDECCVLFVSGDENELKIKLEYYASNIDEVRSLKKKILESDHLNECVFLFMYSVDRWNKLSNLIHEIYPDDSSLALQSKKQIVLSFATSRFRDKLLERGSNLQEFITITEQLRFTDEERENLKLICSNFMKETLRHSTIPESYSYETLEKLTTWCFGDKIEAISNFKSTISADIVFDNFFDRLLENYFTRTFLSRDLLSQLSEFLRWYFTSEQEIKKFKIDKIYNCDFEILKILLKRDDKFNLDKVLKWGFDNDKTVIHEFKIRAGCKT